MRFRSVVRDCLHLNWALPRDRLPALPEPLAYDVVHTEGEPRVFASVALFRLERLHLRRLPLVKLSHPQLSVRLCVQDGAGLPAVYLPCVLVPAWAIPGARLVAFKPARPALFEFPRGGFTPGASRRWRVRRRSALELAATVAEPAPSGAPRLGDWRETVRYFERRRYGYFRSGGSLRRMEIGRPSAEVVPIDARLADVALVADCLGLASDLEWPELHSAWYCPEIQHVFEVALAPEATLARQVPAPG